MRRQPVKHANNDLIGIRVCYFDIKTIFIGLQIEKDHLKIKRLQKDIMLSCYKPVWSAYTHTCPVQGKPASCP